MIELQHRTIPTPALTQFVAAHPNATAVDFNNSAFQPVKTTVKADLNADQSGLCVYCESPLAASSGQVEHIKPKGGLNAYPQLCFSYTNYAHSCINAKTCGQKKKDGLLPIEPGPGCNSDWSLATGGTIEPIASLNRNRCHQVKQTRDMLGLNKDSNLVAERKRWLASAIAILQQSPADLPQFLQIAPYRHILAATV
jgi:uncharacterized protein (TIGR02646 family)